jgi:GNAT superfamily N-acetyltransferase
MQLPNGYYQLPPGKMANAVTWLERTDLEIAQPSAANGLALRRLGPPDAALHRKLYRTIGEPWLWSGLLMKSKKEMEAYLANPAVLSFAAFDGAQAVGMLDLETSAGEGVEIAYFGLAPSHVGKGAGAWLMDEAVRIARQEGHARLWLHTCNFDHPKAVPFYQKQGFRIYAQGFEIMDDPRREGHLPREAAPHVPFMKA